MPEKRTDLTEFILARVAEDEAEAKWPSADWVEPYEEPLRWHLDSRDGPDMLVVHPAHVLRQCEAIRRIVEEHHRSGVTCPRCSLGTEDGEVVFELDPCRTLRDLASIWADHPGYRQEWAT